MGVGSVRGHNSPQGGMTWAGINIADDSTLAIDVDQLRERDLVPIDASLRVTAPNGLSFPNRSRGT
jgi:hypothetical protein